MTGEVINSIGDNSSNINYYNLNQNLIVTGVLYDGGLGDDGLTKAPEVGDNVHDLVEAFSTFNEYDKGILRTHIYHEDNSITSSYSIAITGNGNRYCTLPFKYNERFTTLYYMKVDNDFNITEIVSTNSADALYSTSHLVIGYDCYYKYKDEYSPLYRVDAETLEQTELSIRFRYDEFNSNRQLII